MVSNKKVPTISPLAATQQNQMPESDGGANKSANWMREQWVANLKKKSLENGTGFSGPAVRQLAPGGNSNRSSKAGARGTNRRVASNQRQQQQQLLLQQQHHQQLLQQQQQLQLQQQILHQHNLQLQQQQQQQHFGQQPQQHTSIAPMLSDCHAYTEKDLSNGSLYFNDLGGCFEIESQSFTPLTPTAGGFDFLLPSPLGCASSSSLMTRSFDAAPTATTTVTTAMATGNPSTNSIDITTGAGVETNPPCKLVSSPESIPAPNRGEDVTNKSNTMRTKPLLKKRTNVLALEVDQPKPRTPRRKLNCGNAFEDFGEVQSPPSSATASLSSTPTSTTTQFYTSVGTPSNYNAELSRMWGGPDLDFNSASFVDTFLDLPTPKSAAILAMHSLPTQASASQVTPLPASSVKQQQPLPTSQLESQPQSHDDTDISTIADDLVQPKLVRTTSIEQEGLSHFLRRTSLRSCTESGTESGKSPSLQSRHMPTHHHQIKKNQIDLSEPYSQAAHGAVDECFSKLLPAARRNSLLLPSPYTGGISSGLVRPLASTTTPRSVMVRGPNGEYKLEQHKNMPEFETLLDEYKFTDIDHELDTFYLDTIESIGGDLDRISN